MKKNVIKTTVAAVCVVAAGMGGFKAYNAAAQSEVDMLLAENVEALSYGDAPGFGCKEKTITIIVGRTPCLAYSWEKKYTGYDKDKAYYQWEVDEEVYGYSSQTQTITVPIEDPRTDQSSMVTTCGACPSGKVTSPAALTEEKPLGVQEEPNGAQYNISNDPRHEDTNPFRDRTSVDSKDTNPFRYSLRTDEPTFIKERGGIRYYRVDDPFTQRIVDPFIQRIDKNGINDVDIAYRLDDDVTIGKNVSVAVRLY